jgi:hypothetical protein
MLKKLYFILFAISAIPLFCDAQSFYAIRRNRNLMVSGGSGIAYYQGDMVDPGEFGFIKPNIAVGAEYYFLPRFSARAGITWFMMKGDDRKANDDRVERNLHFRSSNWELSTTVAVNLIPTGVRFYQRARINLHLFTGIGLLYFNPKAELDGKWHALQPLETEGKKYSRFQPVIPFGMGARIKLDPFWNVIIEGGYRKTFTDYLDDVSRTRYINKSTFTDEVARALSDRRPEYFAAELAAGNIESLPPYVRDTEAGYQRATEVGKRGNPAHDDGYFIMNITIQYYLPKEILRNSQRKLYNRKRKAIYRRPGRGR